MTTLATHRVRRTSDLPGYISHPDFSEPRATQTYAPQTLLTDCENYDTKYMPDEVTREHAKRMHFAAYRAHIARTVAERARWLTAYHKLRDRVVLGNRKLIYRAVRRRMEYQNRADDMIGECYIVLIQVVAAFNPWLNVRFSTYAYTCLVRALSRSSRRLATDWLSRSLSFESLPDGEPGGRVDAESSLSSGSLQLDEYLRDSHPLLSDREKAIIVRRFSLGDSTDGSTLEQVGEAVGLSKERVRQVQATAIGKLRMALGSDSDGI
ncbi:MAG: hypothetical protein C0467_12245 [Planctomycetaceae bacterium]|nr:hypothetical protein [Planctomycetaceae bacterium]